MVGTDQVIEAVSCLPVDEVFDLETRECWTLDETDYGDEGSTS